MAAEEMAIEDLLTSCEDEAQEFYQNAGSGSYKLPGDGNYCVLLGACKGKRVTTKSDKVISTIEMQATLVNESPELEKEFPNGFPITLWANSYDDQTALKQLAGLLEEGFDGETYAEAVRAVAKNCADVAVAITLDSKERGGRTYRKVTFNEVVSAAS